MVPVSNKRVSCAHALSMERSILASRTPILEAIFGFPLAVRVFQASCSALCRARRAAISSGVLRGGRTGAAEEEARGRGRSEKDGGTKRSPGGVHGAFRSGVWLFRICIQILLSRQGGSGSPRSQLGISPGRKRWRSPGGLLLPEYFIVLLFYLGFMNQGPFDPIGCTSFHVY